MRIYAVFDVLFTGLNNVAVYQHGQISGMLPDTLLVITTFVATIWKGDLPFVINRVFSPWSLFRVWGVILQTRLAAWCKSFDWLTVKRVAWSILCDPHLWGSFLHPDPLLLKILQQLKFGLHIQAATTCRYFQSHLLTFLGFILRHTCTFLINWTAKIEPIKNR